MITQILTMTLVSLCAFFQSTLAQEVPPAGGLPGGTGANPESGSGTGSTNNAGGWKTRVVSQTSTRTLTVSRGSYSWEGLSESDLRGTKVLAWEDPHCGDNNSKATGYDDNSSRGELEYLASSAKSHAFSRIETVVDDAWDYGDTTLTLTTTTDFFNAAELYWDGDEMSFEPADAVLTAAINLTLHVDGTVTGDTDNPATSTATAKFTATWNAEKPFDYDFSHTNVGLEGRAASKPASSSYVRWVGLVKLPVGWGAGVSFGNNLDATPGDNVYSEDLTYSASVKPIAMQITSGVGYSWLGTSVATGTAYSNGATAIANAKADLTATMGIVVRNTEDELP